MASPGPMGARSTGDEIAALTAGLTGGLRGLTREAYEQAFTSATGVPVAPTPRTAGSAVEYARLKNFYRQAQDYGAGGIKSLENGRFRFYGKLEPSRTPGEMAGRRLVREWDPMSDNTRTWHETLDHGGIVRQVRPEPRLPQNHFVFDAEGNYGGTR
ncbi:MAG TPA: hypothetical protein VK324_03125 [Tepidisphaeraceae bacterium]|nr:hypothetical protein [Tepidisphaeraceae bacterium]